MDFDEVSSIGPDPCKGSVVNAVVHTQISLTTLRHSLPQLPGSASL